MWREIISEDDGFVSGVVDAGVVMADVGTLDMVGFVASMGLKKREKRTRRAKGTRRKRTMLEKPSRELDSWPVEGELADVKVIVLTWSAMTCMRLAWTEFMASLSMLERWLAST